MNPSFADIATRIARIVLAVLLSAGGRVVAQPLHSESLVHGPFEVVAQGRRISTGAFPNNSGNPFATMEVTSFAVRWQGKAVDVPGVGTRFWRVLRILDAPRPALLVSTTDFHLVTERDGRLEIRRFGQQSTNLAQLQWLDALAGQPGPQQVYGIQKEAFPQRGTELAGGRWLLLGHHTVLDVRTLDAFPIRPWVRGGPVAPRLDLNASIISARMFSPARTQFVSPGEGTDERGAPVHALVVVDIPSGDAYGLTLDPRRTRFADAQDFDFAWIDHYFEWRRATSGREQFVPRPGARPLPWKGRFVDFRDHEEYRVPRIAPAFVDVVRTLMIERLGAKAAPDPIDPKRSDGRTFTVAGCDGVLSLSATDEHVGVYESQAKAPPRYRCREMIRRIGQLVDAELATGRHDNLLRFD